MAETKESLIEKIMKECLADGEPVTREEAEEMATAELRYRDMNKYVQSEPSKKATKPKERKVDAEKAEILDFIRKGLVLIPNHDSADIKIENESKLHFTYNGTSYTVNLIKHRPPK